MTEKINLAEKLSLFDEQWKPKIVARINDYDVRIVKVKGEFVWHKHDDTDDFFLVPSSVIALWTWTRARSSSSLAASNIALGQMKRPPSC